MEINFITDIYKRIVDFILNILAFFNVDVNLDKIPGYGEDAE